MSDVEYVLGTVEYIIFEIDCTTPNFTFTAGEWTAKAALCLMGTAFDADAATWVDATLEDVSGTVYAKVLAGTGTMDPAAGTYKGFVKLTKTVGGVEIPVLPGRGRIKFVSG